LKIGPQVSWCLLRSGSCCAGFQKCPRC